VLVALIPAGVPIVNAIRVDHFVLFFALVLSAVASIAFGLAPAFLAANSNWQVNLREGRHAFRREQRWSPRAQHPC
jgi:hypothetical protein